MRRGNGTCARVPVLLGFWRGQDICKLQVHLGRPGGCQVVGRDRFLEAQLIDVRRRASAGVGDAEDRAGRHDRGERSGASREERTQAGAGGVAVLSRGPRVLEARARTGQRRGATGCSTAGMTVDLRQSGERPTPCSEAAGCSRRYSRRWMR